MKKYNVAIVGTGAVGQELLNVLAERAFPINELKLLATERSAGKQIEFNGEIHTIKKTTADEFKGVDIALFAGGGASKEYAQVAVENGAVVVDNSSHFRMAPEVPLVVPEVNPDAVMGHKGIIANPNCSTIQMVVALNPIHQVAKIKRVVVSTYQAVSGSGVDAMKELESQSKDFLVKKETEKKCYPHQIAYNMLPHIDVFLENDYSKEEVKMINETKKIMGSEEIKITATTVRVPVFNGHSESINIETEKKLSGAKAKEILAKAPGIIVEDDPMKNVYPMPINVQGRDEVFVGRIREDNSVSNGLNIWVVADNLRKGAATNTVQIAELLIEKSLV